MKTCDSPKSGKRSSLVAGQNRFGRHEPSRVFIRACQQVNGSENQLWRFGGSGFVPGGLPGPKLEETRGN